MGNSKNNKKNKHNTWPIKVFFVTFAITMLLSLLSETTLIGVSLPVAILVLLFIMSVGVVFDIVGVAVTFENVGAYNAMASKKIKGAKQAIKLVQSASTVSNICNDVVGDICGIVSGAMGAAIGIKLFINSDSFNDLLISILISSIIAALTVGAKAFGKSFAVKNSHKIVFTVGKIFAVFINPEKGSKKKRK
ncbi:MAG: hypothetical protein RRY79_07515 [Clostridia bacterium]